MIRRLRRRHLVMHAGLAVLLPIGVALGLRARSTVPQQALPGALTMAEPEFGELVFEREVELDGRPLLLAVGRDTLGRSTVALQARDGVRHPSLLVYWEPGPIRAEGEEDPDQRLLLGTLFGTQRGIFVLPGDAVGRVILHSLGHGEDVALIPVQKES